MIKRLSLIAVILLVSVGADQITKVIAKDYLLREGSQSYLGDTVRLQYAENSGAFLGFGDVFSEELRAGLFIIVVSVVLLALFIYLLIARHLNAMTLIALSLILSGGLGNLIDRIFLNGTVRDFLNVGIGRLRTGIFNVADMAIVAGVLLLLVVNLRPKPE